MAALGLDGGFGTIAPEDPLRPTPGSWQVDVSDRRCSPGEQHCRTSRRGLELDPQLSSPCRLGHHRGTARGMGSWSGTLPSKQAERPHFRTTVGIAPHRHPEWAERMAWDVDGHDRAHPPSKPAEPTFRTTVGIAPHRHPEWAEGFSPPGRQSGTRSGCCPSMQFSPPCRCAG